MTDATAGPRSLLGRPRGRGGQRAVELTLAGAGAFVVLLALAIVGFIARAGIAGFAHNGLLQTLFGLRWSPEGTPESFGFLPYLFGTGITAIGAVFLGAVPAVLTAVWLSEFARPRTLSAARRVLEVSSALPSVVFGYLAVTRLVPLLADSARGCQGLGILPAVAVLAAMLTPTVALLSLDALARTPAGLREASAALGASRWQTTFRAVVPAAGRGLLVAGFYGFARAAGETMAVQMVAGNGTYAPLAALRPAGARLAEYRCAAAGPFELLRPMSTISTRIVTDLPNTQPGSPWNNALFSMSLVLLLFSTAVVVITRRLGPRAAS